VACGFPKEAKMKCAICGHDEVRPGTVTMTLERGDATLVIKGVPARVCSNCGEAYLDEEVTASLLHSADAAVQSGVQVEVSAYAPA
jgi:YgiT-type zinc finger domain-containing protein